MSLNISENPGDEWDSFVQKYTVIPFYSSCWGRFLREALNAKLCYMEWREDGKLKGGMPAVLLTYWGVKLLYSGLPHGGYVGERQCLNSFMENMTTMIKGADIISIMPYDQEFEHCYSEEFEAVPEVATRVCLKGKSLAEVQGAYNYSARRYGVKQNGRPLLDVYRSNDLDDFIIAYQLYLQSMRRNQALVRYSRHWFSSLAMVPGNEGLATVYVARHEGEPVAAIVSVESSKGCHLLHITSSTRHLHLRPNEVVVNRVISDSVQTGKEYVDFMLSSPNDSSLIRWKEKFGGVTVSRCRYQRVNSPIKYRLWQAGKSVCSFMQNRLRVT